jgi:hypothetical protein
MPKIKEFRPVKVDFDSIVSGNEIKVLDDGEVDDDIDQDDEPILPPKEEKKVEPEVIKPDPPKDEDFDPDKKVSFGEEKAIEKRGPGRPPKDAMREQLERLAAEKKAVDEQYEADKKAWEEEKANLAAAAKERDGLKADLEARRVKESAGDLMRHPTVLEITAQWEARFDEFINEADENGVRKASQLRQPIVQLAAKYNAARQMEDEDARIDAMAEVKSEVGELVGDEMQGAAMSLVRDAAARLPQVNAAIQELQKNFPQVEYRQRMDGFEQMLKKHEELESASFNPPAEAAKSDPLNPSVVMRAIIDGSPEAKTASASAKNFARLALLPPPPVNPDDFAGLDEEGVRARVDAINARHTNANATLRKILPEALLARQLIPGLYARLSQLESLIAGDRKVLRQKSDGTDMHKEIEEEEEIEASDIRNFKPTNPALEEFEASNGR